MLEQRLVRRGHLLQQRRALVAGIPQASYTQGRGQSGSHSVTHGVGHGQVQDVARQAEVEGVSRDAGGRLQPAREGERPGLAGLRPGEQTVLDLRREAQGPGSLTPLVEVGVPPVRDHHERQQVCQLRDLAARRSVRGLPKGQLEEADDLSAFCDRGQHQPRSAFLGPSKCMVGRDDLHLLGAHGELRRPTVERHDRGRLLDCAPLARRDRGAGASSRSLTCASRTRARPDRSAMRNETLVAPSVRPSSRVTASTASTGEAASAAAKTLPNVRAPASGSIVGA